MAGAFVLEGYPGNGVVDCERDVVTLSAFPAGCLDQYAIENITYFVNFPDFNKYLPC